MDDARPQVLVLNGGSSSGKTTLAHCLQDLLDGYWLRLGLDTLIDAAPRTLFAAGGLAMADDGTIDPGPDFVEIERQWMAGVGAMAAAGAHILVEDNFISGATAQERWAKALDGVAVGWIGVRCDPEIAKAREAERVERIAGMAETQAYSVHEGIVYDLEVDAGRTDPKELAATVRDHFFPAG